MHITERGQVVANNIKWGSQEKPIQFISGTIRFWLVMSLRAEGEAIYINLRDCFVATLLAMTVESTKCKQNLISMPGLQSRRGPAPLLYRQPFRL